MTSTSIPSPSIAALSAPTRSRAWVEHVKVYLRSSVCSLLASVVDMAVVELCVRGFAMDPALSKVPAMVLGTLTQFWASRHFAFRAGSGRLGKQLPWYLAMQLVAAGLTVLLFHLLVHTARVPLEISNIVAGTIVTNAFSYPLSRWIFAIKPEPAATPSRPEIVPAPAPVPAVALSPLHPARPDC